jgi:ribosomal protein S18 acetylase RimI-like enzyme
MKGLRISECGDAERLLRMILEIFPSANPEFGEGNVYFMATFHGEDAGFLHLILDERAILLQGIGVRRKFRGRGIGDALMDKALEFAEDAEGGMLLKVKPENTAALNLYAKKGFTIKKVRDVYILEKKQFT